MFVEEKELEQGFQVMQRFFRERELEQVSNLLICGIHKKKEICWAYSDTMINHPQTGYFKHIPCLFLIAVLFRPAFNILSTQKLEFGIVQTFTSIFLIWSMSWSFLCLVILQHVLEHGRPHERCVVIKKLAGQIVKMSQQKFASNDNKSKNGRNSISV